jgi:nicotinamide-nucleotide amidase
VGEELLSGATVDGNAAWLGRRLAALGIPVRERFTVGDRDERIRLAVRRGLELAPVVVVTGGLGPTEDDRTRPAVAAELDAPLEEDPSILQSLEARFRDYGLDELPPANRRQAMVPRGGRALENRVGTAPGLWIPAGDGRGVALLPGVPREMQALFGAVAREIRALLGERLRPVHSTMVHTTGIAESKLAPQVEEALGDARRGDGVDVAYLPDLTGVDLRFTVADRSEDEAAAVLERTLERLERVLAPYRFDAPESGDLVEALGTLLDARGLTAGTAESCTGGGVAERLTGRAGSSAWFLGGVVAYADRVKQELLGVSSETLGRHGAVSTEVAEEMVRGCIRALGCDCAVALTGIAGPGGGTDEKPVGTVCYAAAWPGEGGLEVAVRRRVFPGDRAAVRRRSGQAALALLHRRLRGEG